MGTDSPTKLSVIDEEKENASGDESGNSIILQNQNSFNNFNNYNRSSYNNLKDEKIKTFFYKSVIKIF
jgi:hypothetical protein